ncbi:UNKNOWN [Stylonychia lemnae]|uniref:Transmembrane protein n=1 Tax=Stylonychia lemnae TaxID=5949 RepID=A0A078A7E8_STYLE|nr:UNKNOWN [Stylonychia lemnae]|eukprot:CDW76716.1 UNKNOWN [Stylonychia lemnae]
MRESQEIKTSIQMKSDVTPSTEMPSHIEANQHSNKQSLGIGEEFQVYEVQKESKNFKQRLVYSNYYSYVDSAVLLSFWLIFMLFDCFDLHCYQMWIMLYSMMPVFFICDQGIEISEGWNDLMIILLAILLMPTALIKDFNRIKVKYKHFRFLQILAILIFATNIVLLITVGIFSFIQPDKMESKPESEFINYKEPWLFIPKIQFAFEFQAYFMIVYQYLGTKNQNAHGMRVASYSAGINFLYCSIFCFCAFGAHKIHLNCIASVNLLYSYPVFNWAIDWQLVIISVLQIPFKFYLGKEFVLILFDELMYKSLSSKIDDMKAQHRSKKVFTDLTVHKVREDLYDIIRMPYMRFSKAQYNSISLVTYLINFLMVLFIRGYYHPNFQSKNPLQYVVRISAAIVQPLMIFVFPGFLYKQTCDLYDIKCRFKFLLIPFGIIGFLLIIINVTLVIYEMVILISL